MEKVMNGVCGCGQTVPFVGSLQFVACPRCNKMVSRDKSLLHGMQVKEEPCYRGALNTDMQSVVSACPKCGAPIYGRDSVRPGEPSPPLTFSCECRKR